MPGVRRRIPTFVTQDELKYQATNGNHSPKTRVKAIRRIDDLKFLQTFATSNTLHETYRQAAQARIAELEQQARTQAGP
ncbi:MAG: hypothetical protein A2660_00220 [Candidatus Doudnabacteria bacterium RIFCSPHIGHO2_01_FULL_45_18]|uniref:Uncharacterized protein n=1 Tax=Candidatus Doudnabacteria bacterium RIFCSPHIGHO2_01_FULL_45_18 TaxID=1817823 RepID=A0A1F5NSN6_9BACT|nr:MAG: hypothetical protein A2660_00220 [Candidatus Doudnabacteria bacterium RIFCSPHIGHO2_01_FULL_45_18]